jgi:AraC-like DNA-binding protein
MDPLSDVLSLLKLHSYGCGGFDIGGDRCLQFPEHAGIKCYPVVSGQGWLSVDGVRHPVQLKAGDCFLLPPGPSFRLASDLTLPLVDALTFRAAKNGTMGSINGSAICFIVGGHFALTGNHASILLGVLPPIVHLQKESDKAALRWSIERMMEELREPQPGGLLIAQHLSHMMLVQALRLHLAEGLNGGVGWLFALADKQMSGAINAMHEEPGYRWTLQKLAARVGMSRSAFAQKFKETVGKSPMEYLTRWRMLVAGDRLVNSGDPVSVISLALGYESEAAFSTAFKRVMGCSPRQYSRRRAPTLPSDSEEQATRADRLEPIAG